MKLYRIPNPIPFLLILLGLIIWGLTSCNTSKRAMDKSREATEQTEKSDSTFAKDSTGSKSWESVVEVLFKDGKVKLFPGDFVHNIPLDNNFHGDHGHNILLDAKTALFVDSGQQIITDGFSHHSGAIELSGVEKITIRSKGKDTSSKKETGKKVEEKKLDKKVWTKNVQKETKRLPIGAIIGLVLLAALVVAIFSAKRA